MRVPPQSSEEEAVACHMVDLPLRPMNPWADSTSAFGQ